MSYVNGTDRAFDAMDAALARRARRIAAAAAAVADDLEEGPYDAARGIVDPWSAARAERRAARQRLASYSTAAAAGILAARIGRPC